MVVSFAKELLPKQPLEVQQSSSTNKIEALLNYPKGQLDCILDAE